MKPHSAARLLIVDDEKDIANITKIWMVSKGFAADVFYHPEQALSAFRASYYDLAILDVRMPGITGFELYEKLREKDPALKVCFMSAMDGFDCQQVMAQKFPSLKQRQQWAFVKKPEALDKVTEVVMSLASAKASGSG